MNRRKLLAKMRNNPSDVRFSDLVLLVEAAGFTLRGGEGSHRVYTHPDNPSYRISNAAGTGRPNPTKSDSSYPCETGTA